MAPDTQKVSSGVYQPHPNRWAIVFLLFVGMTVSYVDRTNLAVAAAVIESEMGLSKSAIGLALSVFFWVYAAMQLPAGWLVDRFDIRKTYAWAFAGWSVVTVVTGFARGITDLVAARTLLAAGESVSTPASHRSIRHLFAPWERGLATGIYSASTKLGPAIGIALGAWLIMHAGWRGLFFFTGTIGLLWLVPWLRLYRDRSRQEAHRLAGRQGVDGRAAVLSAIRQRTVRGIFLGFFCYGYVYHVYTMWLPSYLVSERKLSLAELGLWGPLPFVALAMVVPLAGWIADRLVLRHGNGIRVRKAFIAAGFLLGMLIIPAALVPTTRAAVAFFIASAGGIGLGTANIWVITQTLAPARQVGTWSGIQNFGGILGASLSPLVTGILADATGSFTAALTVAGLVSCLGMLCYSFLVSGSIDSDRKEEANQDSPAVVSQSAD